MSSSPGSTPTHNLPPRHVSFSRKSVNCDCICCWTEMLCLLYLLDADVFPPWLWTPWDDDKQRFHFARSMFGCCWLLHIVTVSIYAYALLQVEQNPYKSYNRIPFRSQFTHPKKMHKKTKKLPPKQIYIYIPPTKNLHTSPASLFLLVRQWIFPWVTLWGLHYSKWCHHEWHSSQPSSLTFDRGQGRKLTGSQAIDDEAKACWNGGVRLEIAPGSGWENYFLGKGGVILGGACFFGMATSFLCELASIKVATGCCSNGSSFPCTRRVFWAAMSQWRTSCANHVSQLLVLVGVVILRYILLV